jgi:hypothetical protein
LQGLKTPCCPILARSLGHVRKVDRQLEMSTPAFSNVLCLGVMCGAEKVIQLINHPVMSLFGTRMSGTSTEMVSHRIHLKLPATTSR